MIDDTTSRIMQEEVIELCLARAKDLLDEYSDTALEEAEKCIRLANLGFESQLARMKAEMEQHKFEANLELEQTKLGAEIEQHLKDAEEDASRFKQEHALNKEKFEHSKKHDKLTTIATMANTGAQVAEAAMAVANNQMFTKNFVKTTNECLKPDNSLLQTAVMKPNSLFTK